MTNLFRFWSSTITGSGPDLLISRGTQGQHARLRYSAVLCKSSSKTKQFQSTRKVLPVSAHSERATVTNIPLALMTTSTTDLSSLLATWPGCPHAFTRQRH